MMKRFTVVPLVVLVFFACSEEKTKMAELALKSAVPEEFIIKNDQDDTLLLPTGSSVVIPANSLVDANGKAVEGEVKVSFREYHSKAEILLSSLPMTYKDSVFESAGMFNIQGHCDGRPVFISKQKPLTVNIVSEKKGNDYNFYALQDSTWTFVEKARILSSAPDSAEAPEKPFELASNKNISFIEFDVNYSKMPELKGFSGVLWTYAGDSDADNPEKNQWVYKQQWTDTKIEKDAKPCRYKVTLEKGSKTFVTYVRPVFPDADKKLAEQRFAVVLNAYEEAMAQRESANKQTSATSDLTRSAAVFVFGTYNFDKCGSKLVNALVTFQLEGQEINAAQAYLILPRSVVSYKSDKGKYEMQIPLNERKFKFALAVNDSTFAFVNHKGITDKIEASKKGKVQEVQIEAQVFPKSIHTLKDLERFLEEI